MAGTGFRYLPFRWTLPLRMLLWPLTKLRAPFSGLMRELMKIPYLWQKPLRLENSKLLHLLGREPYTPLDEAMRLTLIGLGCVGHQRLTCNTYVVI
ncbi:hypothetical protein S2091_4162 [Solimicrobium silvestre]|uniref:Uncharacterized protein n=1 Tax=Solimicrobium silvestre TaxID=2099400 RepID=A0A2S9GTX9_9BURK|nr:hypothetical protein S2091_4162 [Solimicrobium silvestre]